MADSISATPVVNPLAELAARYLGAAERFARAPGGYANPPVAALSDLLGVPAVVKTLERLGYGEPLTTGRGMTTRLRPDTLEAALAVAPMVGPAAQATKGLPVGAIIKPKGGNWLAGQVEKAVAPLKQPLPSRATDAWGNEVANPLATMPMYRENEAVNRWLEGKLTKYIKNEMATPEDPLRLAADRWAQTTQPRLLAEKQAQIDKAIADLQKAQRERGVPEEYLTSSRARILELEKERDLITARTGLHAVPRPTPELYRNEVRYAREMFGYPRDPVAVSESGKRWEDLADRYLAQRSSAGRIMEPNFFLRQQDAERVLAENPWLAKVPPETEVQMLNRGLNQQDTGFKHMVDELRNAMNPESGLPRELQITAKDLDKMNVAQVAELVDRINAHRAVQKAEANALAAQKSVEVYKEYPESEKGLRWVEMKQLEPKELKLPEGYQVVEDPVRDQTGRAVQQGYRLYSPGGSPLSYGETPTQAYAKYFGKKDLEEALRYEGDVMQHCVGGYCPDVVEGRSRIFSLRDAKGQPYATVEVKPDEQNFQTFWDSLNDAQRAELQPVISQRTADMISQVEQRPEIAQYGIQAVENMAWKMSVESLPQFKQYISQPRLYIEQIKGYKNAKPADEVMPYVQDFVKSQPWSRVEDLQNTGLYRVTQGQRLPGFSKEIEPGFYSLEDFQKMAVENDMPQEILESWMSKLKSRNGMSHGGAVGMAEGGLVEYDPERVSALAASLWGEPPKGYAAGGEATIEDQPHGPQGNWPSTATLAAGGGAVVFDSGKIQGLADALREGMYG